MSESARVLEGRRLEAVRRLALLDTPAEERFDRITRLAARILGLPWAFLTLVDQDREYVKSSFGPELGQTTRAHSLAAWTLRGSGPLIVPDLLQHPDFRDLPLAKAPAGVRFYAGLPLRGRKGLPVGALSVMGLVPQVMNVVELEVLADLAAQAEAELRVSRLSWVQQELVTESDLLKRQEMVDEGTRTWSRSAILELLSRETRHAGRMRTQLSGAVVQVEGRGDAGALLHAAGRLRRELRSYDAVGRVGEREFFVLLPGADLAEAAAAMERTRGALEAGDLADCTINAGVAQWGPGRESAAGLFARALQAQAEARLDGGNRVRMAPQVLSVAPGLTLNS